MALEMIPYHGKELFCPKYDRVFKALLLGDDNDYTLLSSFLTGVLATEIRPENIISASSTELPTKHGNDKIVRLDIRVTLADGTAVNIELQVSIDISMGARSLYQLSRIVAGSIDKGQVPEDICPVIAINVLDFDYIKGGDGYHNRYRMKNVVTGAEMPGAEVFEVHFIELPKFHKNTAGNTMKELWVKFLTAKKEEDLEMLTKESPVMASAVNRLVYASGTKELREQMDDYHWNEVKNRLTMAAERKEGRLEGRLEVAKNLLGKGMKPGDVAEVTGLPIDDVLRL
jgi:predicted transposase/invertase (TIGR01784 family)